MFEAIQLAEVVSTVFYTIVGVLLMGATFKLIDWMTPFSINKEIEEDQNVALAVLIGFVFLSVAVIIAAVIVS